jgi:hypothetical protein
VPNQPAFKAKPKRVPKGSRWRFWPTKAEVPGLYNVTPHRLAAAVNRAHLSAYSTSDGNIRFKPAELRAVFGSPNTPDRDDDDERDDERDTEPVRLDAPITSVHELAKELTTLLREQRKEKFEALAYALDPIKEGIKLQRELVDGYKLAADTWRMRCEKLEADRDAIAVEREKLISETHVRDLQLKREEKAEERRATIVKALTEVGLPMLLQGWVAGQSAPKDAQDFLLSLEPEMLKVVRDALEPEQQAKLDVLLPILERLRPRPNAENHQPTGSN